MDQDLKELLSALNAQNVKYLVVGGYAVGVHAEPRATKDLDIFIKADQENGEAVFRALAAYGAPLAGYSVADFSDGGSWFQMGQPPLRIDILQQIDGVDFDEAWERRVETKIDGELPVHVISMDDLIRNKLACGRPRDLLDVEELRHAAATDRAG
jgi:Nucleotidyl transferase of unknown function (DUF2204)